MFLVIFWTVVFSFSSAISITLLGQRDLIGGDINSISRILLILFNWKFIVSMIFALISRVSFMMTNNALLKIPKLAESATTITTFITLISLVLVVIFNFIFLKERLSVQQIIGAIIIFAGVWILLK